MAAGYQMKGNIVFYLLMKYISLLTSRFSAICLWLNSCHMGICWHDCSRIQPDIDVSKNATCTICRGWMAAGYQMKGNIVFYLLMKYLSLLTSRFRQYVFNWSLVIWRLCWHGRARIHPDIDVSKNATCTICRGWMTAGHQMKGNIVFYLLMKYFSLLTSRFSHNMSLTKVLSFGGCVDMVVQEYILISMFPRTPYAQSAAAEWLRGIKWKAILFSICWWNMFHS